MLGLDIAHICPPPKEPGANGVYLWDAKCLGKYFPLSRKSQATYDIAHSKKRRRPLAL